jgi:beta-glucanase (GH16 family)
VIGVLAGVVCLAAAGAAAQLSAVAPGNGPAWTLVWSDEFDGPALDPAKWRVEDASLVKNKEEQCYSPGNVAVRDGCLVISSRRERADGRAYTSGLVENRGRFAQAFGRFEARIRLPRTRGLWPAFWLLPASGGWPPEIDVMEVLGHEPGRLYMSTHWGGWPGNHEHRTDEFLGSDLSEDFHVFACEWFPDRVDFFVDGVRRATHTGAAVPQEPFFVILNVAVGGDWPGSPDASTELPQEMMVDWVRVYRAVEADRAFLTVNATDGAVRVEPPRFHFRIGETANLIADPEIGFRFIRWAGVDPAHATDNPLALAMVGNEDIRAEFERDPSAPRLLSRGQPVRASSSESALLAPANAVDGDPLTRWASEFSDPQWLRVDLGRVRRIRAVRLSWSACFATDYAVEASEDGLAWATLAERSEFGGARDTVLTDKPGRYVRVRTLKRATPYGASLYELEVFGEP